MAYINSGTDCILHVFKHHTIHCKAGHCDAEEFHTKHCHRDHYHTEYCHTEHCHSKHCHAEHCHLEHCHTEHCHTEHCETEYCDTELSFFHSNVARQPHNSKSCHTTATDHRRSYIFQWATTTEFRDIFIALNQTVPRDHEQVLGLRFRDLTLES